MATFPARSCKVGYTIEGIPTCILKTKTAPTEEYYTFHEATIKGLVDWGTNSNPDLSAWNDTSGAGCTVSIISEFDGHPDVMELSDQGAGSCIMNLDMGVPTANQSLEFWIAKSSIAANTSVFIRIKEGATSLLLLRFRENDIHYYDGAYLVLKENIFVADTLLHLRFIFNDTANTFDCYINGVLEADDKNYTNNSTVGIEHFYIETDAANTGFKIYLDGIGNPLAQYRSGSGFDTQAFEGFVHKIKDAGGFKITTFKHPLWYDIRTPVYEAATNTTPHAYIKNIIDTYFKFCDYTTTSIDDSFGAMDFPAFNGQNVAYVFRFISILKKRWWYCDTHSLNIYWNDGTRYSGKNILFKTQPVIKPLDDSPLAYPDLVTITGAYDIAGVQLTSTNHADTPGSQEVTENFPEIDIQALLDLMSLAAREVWEQTQKYYKVGSAKRGLLQYGQTARFSTGSPLSVSEATYFIHSATYDLVEKLAFVRFGTYMMLPYRSKLKSQELMQLIDNIEKNIHWTERDYGDPDFDDDGAVGTALINNANWNNVDISAIVGAKKMRVKIHVLGKDNAVNSAVFIRTLGHTGAGCRCVIRTGVANQDAPNDWIGHTNSAGLIQIQCIPQPTDWTQISIWITGYRDA